MRLLIQNGYIIDPSQGINAGKSLMLEDGRVVGLSSYSDPVPDGVEIFDATGLVVAPGFIDMHVHLREPGRGIQRDDCQRRRRRGGRRIHNCLRDAQHESNQ
jgi:dihydroorotase